MFIDEHDYVRSCLGEKELLTQFAEECAELGKAALKYRRALDGRNPTPVSCAEAFNNVVEEIADVFLCLSVLDYDKASIMEKVADICEQKMTRWANRLKVLYESEA